MPEVRTRNLCHNAQCCALISRCAKEPGEAQMAVE